MPLSHPLLHIRNLLHTDVPEIQRIEKEAYRELHESPEVNRNKIELCPEGAFGCFEGEKLCGYVFCFPWKGDEVFPLNKTLSRLPDNPDTLYIHDLAISVFARGRGVSKLLMKEVFSFAEQKNFKRFSLVSVQNSQKFWEGFGFKTVETLEYFQGMPAVRMERKGPQPRTHSINSVQGAAPIV